ncbi:MAG: hypothetical protein D6681_15095 [Calditrichaeota bacterium]|nr:MAG: hypothetical protein D6681_15095 [Calditrichota bacterium]
MSISTTTLGRSLACLEAQLKNPGASKAFSPDEQHQAERLRKQLQELESGENLDTLWSRFPHLSCAREHPFLKEHPEIFLAFLFLLPEKSPASGKISPDYSGPLIVHLNSCYHCFEQFVGVLRAYYHGKQATGASSSE